MGEKDISSQEWNSLVSLYYRELMRSSREPSMSPRREGLAVGQDSSREPYKDWRRQNEALSVAESKAEEESLQRRYLSTSSQRQRNPQSSQSPSCSPQQIFPPLPVHCPANTPPNRVESDSGLGEEHNSAEGKQFCNSGVGQKIPSRNGLKNPQNGRMNLSARDVDYRGFDEGDSICRAPYDQADFQEDDSRAERWRIEPGESKNSRKKVISTTAVPDSVRAADIPDNHRSVNDTVRNDRQRRSIERATHGETTVRNDGHWRGTERATPRERIPAGHGNNGLRRSIERVTHEENPVRNDAHCWSTEREMLEERIPASCANEGQRRSAERAMPVEKIPASCVDENQLFERSNSCGCSMKDCGEMRPLRMNGILDQCEQTNGGRLRTPPWNNCEQVDSLNSGGRVPEWSEGKLCNGDLNARSREAGIPNHFNLYKDSRSLRGCESQQAQLTLPEDVHAGRPNIGGERRFEENRIHFSCPASCREDTRPLNNGMVNNGMRCLEKETYPRRSVEEDTQLNLGWNNTHGNGSCCCGNQNSLQSLYRIVSLQSRQMALLEKQVSHLVDFLSSHDIGQLPRQSCDAATMTSVANETIKCTNCASPKENVPNQLQASPSSGQVSYFGADIESPLREEEERERDVSLSQLQEIVVETRDEPSPPTSVHVDVPDYTDSSETEESDTTEDDDPPIGWTFYNNITGQVNRILKGKERKRTKVRLENFTEDDLSALEELRYLQLNAPDALSKRFLAGRSGEDRTVMRAETDTSIKINSLAAKYLQHAPQGSRPSRRHIPVCNIRSGTNMSIATLQYLQRYQLITDGVPAVRDKPTRTRNKVRHREPVPSRILDVTAIKNLPKLLPKKKP